VPEIDKVGLSIGIRGQHHSIAVIRQHEERIPDPTKRHSDTPTTKWWEATQLRSFPHETSLRQLVQELIGLRGPVNDSQRFKSVVVDVDSGSESDRHIRDVLRGSYINVLNKPVSENGGGDTVSLDDMVMKLVIGADEGKIKIPAAIGTEWEAHLATMRSDQKWRQDNSSYLACSLALACWGTSEAPIGYQPGRLVW
jgi:hypothetical protein